MPEEIIVIVNEKDEVVNYDEVWEKMERNPAVMRRWARLYRMCEEANARREERKAA